VAVSAAAMDDLYSAKSNFPEHALVAILSRWADAVGPPAQRSAA